MSKTIDDLRNSLFGALDGLSDRTKPMEIERAKAIADVAQTIINSVKVEVEAHKVRGGNGQIPFLSPMLTAEPPPPGKDVVASGKGYTVRQHQLK